jgi:hypothetical protein
MMATEAVPIEITAELGGLRQQLATLPKDMQKEALAMMAALEKTIKANEKATKQLAKAQARAMQPAVDKAKELGDTFGVVGRDSGKLAGALGMLGGPVADVARNVADLADVGEVAAGTLGLSTAALGPLAIAAGAAGLAIMAMNAEVQSEADLARIAAAANAFHADELTRQEAAALDAAVASGVLSQAAADEARIRSDASERLGAFIAKLSEESRAARESEQTTQNVIGTIASLATMVVKLLVPFGYVPDVISAAASSLAAFGLISDDTEASLRGLAARAKASLPDFDALEGSINSSIRTATDFYGITKDNTDAEQARAAAISRASESVKRARDAEIEATKAKQAGEAATKAATDAEKQRAAQLKAETEAQKAAAAAAEKAVNAVESAQEAARKSSLAAAMSAASDEEKIRLGYEERVRGIREAGAALLAQAGEDGQARAAIAEATNAQIIDAETAMYGELDALRLKNMEAEKAAAAERAANMIANAQQTAEIITQASSLYLDQQTSDYQAAVEARDSLDEDASRAAKLNAEQRVRDERSAAMKAFMVDKALKLAQATAAVALAAANALATPPAPNLFAAGLAAAAGAVQIAAIASQQPAFHAGGVVGAPDEMVARLRSGEAVLNPVARQTLGDANIERLNAGQGVASQGTAVQIVYKHKAFDYFVRDELRTRGTLGRALGAGPRAGQRRG